MKYSLSHSSMPHSLSRLSPGLANMTCLVFSLMARATLIGFLDVVRPHASRLRRQRQSSGGIHGHDAFARQRGTTASIEFGSILHDTNGRADGILGRSALFQQRIAGFKGPVQILLHLGASSGVSFLPRLPAPAWITRRIPSGSAGQPGPSTAAMLLRLLTSSLLQISRLCLTFADILRRWRQRSARHVQKRCRRAVTQSKTYRSATASFLTFHTFANRNLVFHDAPPLVVPVCVKRIVPRTKSRS